MSKHILVYGGSGSLGRAIASTFKNAGFLTTSVDLSENQEATTSHVLDLSLGTQGSVEKVCDALRASNAKFDAIYCAAGGWEGGAIGKPSVFAAVEKMYKFNIESAVATAHLASHFLQPGGVLVLTGAQAALKGTPGMIGYGISKAATHQLIASLAATDSGMPEGSVVYGILPITLDTAMNRKWMADADFTTWTPLTDIANRVLSWVNGENRPSKNGALVQVVTKDSKTEYVE